MFLIPLSRERGFDPGVFGRFNLAALVQPQRERERERERLTPEGLGLPFRVGLREGSFCTATPYRFVCLTSFIIFDVLVDPHHHNTT